MMGTDTGIEWTDHTFNPWWGCTRVSPGCEHCYAETMDKRWAADGKGHWGPRAPHRFFGGGHWQDPIKWERDAERAVKRARVFCASMADVFEDRLELDGPRARLLRLIERTTWLDWQLLTKRPENMIRMVGPAWASSWPANVWAGASVEDQQRADERIPHLLRVPAKVRFLSCEPLLVPVDLALALTRKPWIDWVIIGGESGPGARPFQLAWARSIIAQCKAADVPVFMKQIGARPGERRRCDVPACNCGGMHWQALTTDDRKGGDPAEWPSDIRVQEFPKPKPFSDHPFIFGSL